MIETKEYIVNGEPYTVSIDQEEQFLKDNPNAILKVTQPEVTDIIEPDINNSQGVNQPINNIDIFKEYLENPDIKPSDSKLDFRKLLNSNPDNESLQKLNTKLNENFEKIKLANSSGNNIFSLDNLGYEEGLYAKAAVTNDPNSLFINDSYKYNNRILDLNNNYQNLDPWQREVIIKTKDELDGLNLELHKINEEHKNVIGDRVPVEERVMATFEKFDEIMLTPTDDEEIIRNRYFSKNIFNEGSTDMFSQIDQDEPGFFDENYQKSRATWQSAIQEEKEKAIIEEENLEDTRINNYYLAQRDDILNRIRIKTETLDKSYLNKNQLERYEGLPIDNFSDFGSGYWGDPLVMDKGGRYRVQNIRSNNGTMPGVKTLSELGVFDIKNTTESIREKNKTEREKYDVIWETADNNDWMGYGSEEELMKNIRTYSETEIPKKGEALSP